jgi:predicted CopG family antitoxin
MPTKTISLEMDAYERLKAAKRPGESFSAVVRRGIFRKEAPTGKDLLKWYKGTASPLEDAELEAMEAAADTDPPPDDPWTS